MLGPPAPLELLLVGGTPVVDGGEIRIGRRMKMTISCDHRVMDGAMGARFLQDVKRLLEEPLRLRSIRRVAERGAVALRRVAPFLQVDHPAARRQHAAQRAAGHAPGVVGTIEYRHPGGARPAPLTS